MQHSLTTNMLQIWWIFRWKRDTCLSAPIFLYPVAHAFTLGDCYITKMLQLQNNFATKTIRRMPGIYHNCFSCYNTSERTNKRAAEKSENILLLKLCCCWCNMHFKHLYTELFYEWVVKRKMPLRRREEIFHTKNTKNYANYSVQKRRKLCFYFMS